MVLEFIALKATTELARFQHGYEGEDEFVELKPFSPLGCNSRFYVCHINSQDVGTSKACWICQCSDTSCITFLPCQQVKKLNPAAIRRRSLKKFGDALGQNASDNLTVVSTEEIFLERTRPAGAKPEPEKGADLASLGNASLIVCRTSGPQSVRSKTWRSQKVSPWEVRSPQQMTTWESQGCHQDLVGKGRTCHPACEEEPKATKERACEEGGTTTQFVSQTCQRTLGNKIYRSCSDRLERYLGYMWHLTGKPDSAEGLPSSTLSTGTVLSTCRGLKWG